mmetsp:Transcript_32118/g.75415  ORF Transcript_32118/g.75415 Transcript_32118/m.75415 type:complete len:251 (+) Transcript_32118:733-1485(+)
MNNAIDPIQCAALRCPSRTTGAHNANAMRFVWHHGVWPYVQVASDDGVVCSFILNTANLDLPDDIFEELYDANDMPVVLLQARIDEALNLTVIHASRSCLLSEPLLDDALRCVQEEDFVDAEAHLLQREGLGLHPCARKAIQNEASGLGPCNFILNDVDDNAIIHEVARFDGIPKFTSATKELANMNVLHLVVLGDQLAVPRPVDASRTNYADGKGRLRSQLLLQKLHRICRSSDHNLAKQVGEKVIDFI